ncbi:MAG TPA: SCO family protein [Elusimicrobiota bacterium]|nr:SCO family protein [Elusimicrobiota bacterium]
MTKLAALAALLLAAPVAASASPPSVLKAVGFDQKLGAQAPLDLVFRDEGGKPARLGSLLRGRPAVLALVYYRCPMLCTETLNGLVRALRALSFDAGRDFDVVVLSIDPREGSALAAAKEKVYVERYGRAGGARGWSFLTGDEASIRRLAAAVGFRYAYDRELDLYAHPAGLVVLTPAGRVSKYLFGVEFAAGDLRLALVEAAGGAIGSPIDRFVLYCFHYDPLTGRYGLRILRVLQAAGALTIAGLAALVLGMSRGGRSA